MLKILTTPDIEAVVHVELERLIPEQAEVVCVSSYFDSADIYELACGRLLSDNRMLNLYRDALYTQGSNNVFLSCVPLEQSFYDIVVLPEIDLQEIGISDSSIFCNVLEQLVNHAVLRQCDLNVIRGFHQKARDNHTYVRDLFHSYFSKFKGVTKHEGENSCKIGCDGIPCSEGYQSTSDIQHSSA